jgi:hypothetical protein
MNKSEVKELLKNIVVAYPNFEVPEPRFMLWCDMMADLPFDTAIARLRKHIAFNKYPPSIAEILDSGEHHRRLQQEGDSPAAILAGGYVIYSGEGLN